jgi:ligand-binding sensor domain-containing protein
MNTSLTFRSLLLVLMLALGLWACDFGFGKAESNQADVAVPTPDGGTTFTEQSGLPEDRIYAVASCPNGNVWFGFGQQAGGLTRYDGSNWKTFTKQDGLESDRVYALACDQQNGIWIGYGIQGSGVTRRTGNGWTTYTEQDGLSSNYVATITSEKDGELWIGYAEQQPGVDRFQP